MQHGALLLMSCKRRAALHVLQAKLANVNLLQFGELLWIRTEIPRVDAIAADLDGVDVLAVVVEQNHN